MPTVMRVEGLRIVVYPNDHRPAHVHAIGNGCEAVFDLNPPRGPPSLRENYGFSRAAIGRIRAALTANLAALLDEWRNIHGEP
jgi:hypothetical protein